MNRIVMYYSPVMDSNRDLLSRYQILHPVMIVSMFLAGLTLKIINSVTYLSRSLSRIVFMAGGSHKKCGLHNY